MGEPITVPGRYDISADDYHAHPALSSTGARKLLPPSCPALFKHWYDNGQDVKQAFEHGHAAHALVLGCGPELVLVERDLWNTNEVKAEVADIRARGAVPLKQDAWNEIHAMAAKLREHRVASALFSRGKPEQSLFWTDPQTGMWCRARFDWMPDAGAGGRRIFADYKTTRSAAPDHLQKAINDYGYHQQADFYLAGARVLDEADEDDAFVFVFQEKTAPYLVTVAEPDAMNRRIGAARNRQAIDLYAECASTGHWPGYSDDVVQIAPPVWVENRFLQEEYA